MKASGNWKAPASPRRSRDYSLQPNKKPLVPSPPLFIPIEWLSFLYHKSTINFAFGPIPAIDHKLISTALAYIKPHPTGEFPSTIIIPSHTTQTIECASAVNGQDCIEVASSKPHVGPATAWCSPGEPHGFLRCGVVMTAFPLLSRCPDVAKTTQQNFATA